MTLLPNLMRSGSVGLVWPRLRHRAAEYGAAGLALEAAYQAQVAGAGASECAMVNAVSCLRRAGIDPVLVKGWAISRRYPMPVVRSSGDIDLIVRPSELNAATAALAPYRQHHGRSNVDLQDAPWWMRFDGFRLFDDAEYICVDGIQVRVPSEEAHLRLACLHMLHHGALRPLWLCDIALLMESRKGCFDWDRFLGCDRRRREWMLKTLRLAHEVLGADVIGTPAATVEPLPNWLVPALLSRWQLEGMILAPSPHQTLRDLRPLFHAMRDRWHDPIWAATVCGAPLNRFPRLPIQLAAFVIRGAKYCGEIFLGDSEARSTAPRSPL